MQEQASRQDTVAGGGANTGSEGSGKNIQADSEVYFIYLAQEMLYGGKQGVFILQVKCICAHISNVFFTCYIKKLARITIFLDAQCEVIKRLAGLFAVLRQLP